MNGTGFFCLMCRRLPHDNHYGLLRQIGPQRVIIVVDIVAVPVNAAIVVNFRCIIGIIAGRPKPPYNPAPI